MWWALTTMTMWVSGGIASARSKDTSGLLFSLIGSIALGIFYMVVHGI